jgi:formamidopyrimidine-DNA glycosylase
MPELPDVEGFRRHLARHAQGRSVCAVEVLDPPLVRNRTPRSLARALTGGAIGPPHRHGKWLITPVGGVELLLHFGMTGGLQWSPTPAVRDPHDRLVLVCDGGELHYNNMRRFGGIWLARDARERERVTGPLGPDAAAVDRDSFERLLARRRGSIKAALMDQRLIAGIGNLLSDEILWRAGLHPRTPVPRIRPAHREALYGALRAAVGESTRYGRVPHGGRWLTGVRDAGDASCPRCGRRLCKATIAGRTACWCPRCQRSEGA